MKKWTKLKYIKLLSCFHLW